MSSHVDCSRSALAKACSLLMLMLALVSQLALGAIVLPDDTQAAQRDRMDTTAVLCGGHADRGKAPAHRHHADVAVCPPSVALALPGVVLATAVVFPRPTWVALAAPADRPEIRGPPIVAPRPGLPRGPPVLA
jgi:hypothetical protein